MTKGNRPTEDELARAVAARRLASGRSEWPTLLELSAALGASVRALRRLADGSHRFSMNVAVRAGPGVAPLPVGRWTVELAEDDPAWPERLTCSVEGCGAEIPPARRSRRFPNEVICTVCSEYMRRAGRGRRP